LGSFGFVVFDEVLTTRREREALLPRKQESLPTRETHVSIDSCVYNNLSDGAPCSPDVGWGRIVLK